MISDFDPATNPDPNARPVEFPAGNPRRMAPPPEVNPSGEYMGVNQALQRNIMRGRYAPAPSQAAGPRPAEAPRATNIYQDVATVRAAASTTTAYNQSSFSALGDVELADMTGSSSSTPNNPGGGGGGGAGGGGGGGAGGGGTGASEHGFWTCGRIVAAISLGGVVLGGIGVGVAAAFGAFDSSGGGGGGGGGGTAKKPPTAKPVALTNQPPGKVEIDILNGKDAAGNAWVAKGDGVLAGAGVKFLVGMDSRTSFTAKNEGDWAIDAATGKISFAPLASFTASPTPVNYFVVDANNLQSATASISIVYAAKTVMQPASPVVSDIRLTDQISGMIVIDILGGKNADGVAYVKPGSGALRGNGIFLVSSEGMGQKLPVTGEGEWLVDMTTGKITFTPVAGFAKAPTPVRYLVRDDSNPPLKSNEGRIEVSFKQGPIAVNDVDGDFARALPTDKISVTVDILANDMKIAAGIDPKSVQLVRAIASDPSYTPMATFAADYKSVDVAGEGKWTVDAATGKMTFDALQGFSGQTTAITYTVADVNGVRSNEAIVQLNSQVKAITTALQKLVGGSDAAFWAEYKKHVIDDPAVSIREALVVTSLFNDLFLRTVPERILPLLDGIGTNRPGRPLGADFTALEMQWLNAKGTKDALWTIQQSVQSSRYVGYPEATSPGVVRYICTDVLVRLLRVLVTSMNRMQN